MTFSWSTPALRYSSLWDGAHLFEMTEKIRYNINESGFHPTTSAQCFAVGSVVSVVGSPGRHACGGGRMRRRCCCCCRFKQGFGGKFPIVRMDFLHQSTECLQILLQQFRGLTFAQSVMLQIFLQLLNVNFQMRRRRRSMVVVMVMLLLRRGRRRRRRRITDLRRHVRPLCRTGGKLKMRWIGKGIGRRRCGSCIHHHHHGRKRTLRRCGEAWRWNRGRMVTATTTAATRGGGMVVRKRRKTRRRTGRRGCPTVKLIGRTVYHHGRGIGRGRRCCCCMVISHGSFSRSRSLIFCVVLHKGHRRRRLIRTMVMDRTCGTTRTVAGHGQGSRGEDVACDKK